MPRHPRVHAEGLLYHVMARGNNGQEVFLEPADYRAFLAQLQTVCARYPFDLYAYVLMPNHFHLLLKVGEAPTARIMQSLLTAYVRRFNHVHRRRGHLFQGRYKAIVCDRESYLLELVRYIHLNPVRAGLVRRPSGWKWSGHAEYLGVEKKGLIDRGLVEEFSSAARYEAFVRDGIRGGYRAELHPGDSAPFLGGEIFVKKVVKEKKELPVRRPMAMDVLWRQMAEEAGISQAALRQGGRSARIVEVRDRFMRRAILEEGCRASDVAAFLGCHPSNVNRALRKGESYRT